ncbi:putative membrane protein [Escherichia coli 2-156-04_S3_C1]|nr:putative membrane protein [Escherichia coli 2-156-04_S3_C1]
MVICPSSLLAVTLFVSFVSLLLPTVNSSLLWLLIKLLNL